MKFNPARASKIIEAEKNKPRPKISIKQSTVDSPQSTVERPKPQKETSALLAQCRAEYHALKLEQGQLSNTIAAAVANGDDLRELYARIESYRPELIKLYERMKHVEQYGELPVPKVVNEVPVDIFLLKDQRKKLIDERCKLNAKIKRGHIKEKKVQDWQMRLDVANAEYAYVDDKIKHLEGK